MTSKTYTTSVDGQKIRDIASEILADLVGREDLEVTDIVAVFMDMQQLFDGFLEQEGITINNVKKVYQS